MAGGTIVAAPASGQEPISNSSASAIITPEGMTEAEIDSAEVYLRAALAGPKERSFHQILTEASLVVDTADTAVSYDIVVRYDPDRYHDPHAGLYPVAFEDQFIAWGKRVSLLTRSTTFRSSRFYLQDISTGRTSWIFAEETHRLYPPEPLRYPVLVEAEERTGQQRWLKLIHAVEPQINLRIMSTWLRLMRDEPRDVVVARELAAATAAAAGTSSAGDGNP
ncbi:MAG: hypothetical protein VX733_05375 [Candidatus Latescibacterota bacterium]|nr:hypothetical protein [Candidatus Latescibacterota bacterium]